MRQVPHISDAEWEIMKILWNRSPMTAQEVVDSLANVKDWHPKTIKTLLGRLVHKGALTYEKEGKTYLYTPSITRRACNRTATTSFISRVYDGALTPMIASFIEENMLSPKDIQELRRLLSQRSKNHGTRR